MKTEDLEAFVAVVRCQSLSQAAERLQLTQSAITRRIQSFEETLGVEVFDRHTRPLKPTALGQRLYEPSCLILKSLNSLHEMVAEAAEPEGTLRLGIPQTLGDWLLIEALEQLTHQYPRLHPQVFNGWGNALLEKLDNLELDAVAALFPTGKTIPESLQSRVLGRVPLQVVVARGLAPPKPAHLADYQSQGWILNPDGCGFRAGLQHALHAQGLNLRLNMETFGTELQLGLVAHHLGLGLIPAPLLHISRYREQLDIVPLVDFHPELELRLIYPRAVGHLKQALQLLGAILEHRLNAAPESKATA